MVASKQGEPAPEETAESLPTEVKAEPKKKTMMLAVIIAVIVVIAAVAAAIGLGLLGGGDEEPTNVPPSGGIRAVSGTTIDIGGTVEFESLGTDSDGEIVNYTWMYGDGAVDGPDPDLTETSHVYDYGGSYLVYHEVEDDLGATGDNEAQMTAVTVLLWNTDSWQNDSAPFAFMNLDDNVIAINDTVTFNMTSCAAPLWDADAWEVAASWEYIDSMTLDFGDDSDPVDVTPEEIMVQEHKYTANGHYAASLEVTSAEGVSTIVMYTVHVLKPEVEYLGEIRNPDAFIEVTIGEPEYLDPATDYETAGGEVIMNTYETLIWYDEESTVDLVPVLATEVPTVENEGISEDGMNYTFHIREGITFHDGTELAADDVAYSIQRVLRIHDPNGPSWMLEQIMTSYLSYYVGGDLQTFIDDNAPPQWMLDAIGETDPTYILTEDDNREVAEASVTVVDDMTVNFRLNKPFPAFLKIAAYTIMSVVSMDYVEDNGGIVDGEHNDVMDLTTCGTGPYILPDGGWEHGTKIHLERNDDYWGEAPALKDVYIITATDENTRILMLQAGDADTIAMSIEYESMFQGDPEYEITKGLATYDVTFAGFNLNINETQAALYGSNVPGDFFVDKNVRLAFVHMLDYDTFIENVLKGNAIQPNGVIPKGMFGYDETIPTYEFDLDTAASYLKEAVNADSGNTWWVDGFDIALFYNAGNAYRETACRYLADAMDELTTMAASDGGGVFTATVNTLDWPTYLSLLRNTPSPFPVFYLGWAPDYADPDDYATPFLDSVYGGYPHTTGYANASIDELVRAAAVELDETLRAEMYSEMSMLVYEDAPYIFLWQGNNFHIERAWLEGYYFNPMYPGFYFPAFSKPVATE